MKPDYVYVASSWKNAMQAGVVAGLRAAGIECYDFKNPEHNTGFHWSEVGVDSNGVEVKEYLDGLNHPRSEIGFKSDFDAMHRADVCILVLPSGRSAHIEAGWMKGNGKKLAILLVPEMEVNGLVMPELMYKMADLITDSLFDLLGWLGVED